MKKNIFHYSIFFFTLVPFWLSLFLLPFYFQKISFFYLLLYFIFILSFFFFHPDAGRLKLLFILRLYLSYIFSGPLKLMTFYIMFSVNVAPGQILRNPKISLRLLFYEIVFEIVTLAMMFILNVFRNNVPSLLGFIALFHVNCIFYSSQQEWVARNVKLK